MWGIPIFNFNLSKIKCKTWGECWTYPFPYTSALTSFSFYQDTDKPRYCVSWDLKKPSQFQNSLKFKKKKRKKRNEWWNCEITNTNIKLNYYESRYLFCCNFEQSSQNNQCTWCFPLKYRRIFPKKKASHEGTKTFSGKTLWGGCSKLEDWWSDHVKVWEKFHKL